MSTTIHDILAEFRDAARSKRDMGDKFERLFANYLVTEPYYKDRFSNVWMWTEWPGRDKRPDTGIDLVAEERVGGDLCAIQCKFYDPETTIQKADLDSFFATSGKAPFGSRIVVTTTDNWSKNAELLLDDERVPCQRIRLQDLDESAIDWTQFSLSRPDKMKLRTKKTPRPHQLEAIKDVLNGLNNADRGKLIMACGTGKTFTALKIAEAFAADAKGGASNFAGRILFLVPSIALLGQSLKEWTAECSIQLHALAVCSDTAVGKSAAEDTEDIRVHDLPFPATTDARKLARQLTGLASPEQARPLTVVFSTYQSIATIHDAQKKHGASAFDLIVCDEAHRTTGVTLAGTDESHFVKVHDATYIHAAKRLYMTATPRIYMDATKSKAKEADAELCSMDDEALYGRELHRLGFGEAISRDLLADYKVMVLAVDEKFVSKTFQRELARASKEKGKAYDDYFTDLVKITGCWNGLGKRMAEGDAELLASDTAPMRRAVAFSRSIAASKQIKDLFAGIAEKYIEQAPEDQRGALLRCEADHVDGTMNALVRSRLLEWLKADTGDAAKEGGDAGNICRVLTNARCLNEGVDVPALDAVLFLNPRNSVVDVVQAVGRVMRRAPGKKYGYIILPIGIPADTAPEDALKDNDKYKIVWQVLQALRSHDERIEAAINQIDLTGKKPSNISIIGVSGGAGNDDRPPKTEARDRGAQLRLDFPNLGEWRDAIFARIVLKVGDRRYWESWARDVAQIAEQQITRIKALLEADGKVGGKARSAFDKFLAGLRSNLNPAVSESDAIEMLAQHLITQPVFDALFEGYAFTQNNPVSKTMQRMLDVLRDDGLAKEPPSLQKFYESVRQKASIDIAGMEPIRAAEARQRIVIELYDKFFRTAFAKMSERLGIVYTPVEVVDFILKSADYALRQEFGVGLTNSGVHVLDPFTGTGTFIARLLQGGLITPWDLERKFKEELHANEIVLLAYYIAAVNIEYAYHLALEATRTGLKADYEPFEGIVLTDTFQMTESKGSLEEQMFPDNNKRARRQKAVDIRVIVGNPPYSSKQENANDDNQNIDYPNLDQKIRETYAYLSTNSNVRSLYDSYIRAVRWASDRIKDKGIVCYVTNGSFIDANNMDGLRKTLVAEFSRIFVFNLRGNARTSGEQRQKEKGNIFGSGTRTPVAITLLVKDAAKSGDGTIHYHDIGDYLSREEKLQAISEFGSMQGIPWRSIKPNEHSDWINVRDPNFAKFMVLGDKDDNNSLRVFKTYSQGVLTARDAWAFNFSRKRLSNNIRRMIDFYNSQRSVYAKAIKSATGETAAVDDVIDTDAKKISWSRGLKNELRRLKACEFSADCIISAVYRPFTKSHLYFDKQLNEYPSQNKRLFPSPESRNLVISTTGVGANKEFSALVTDRPLEFATLANGQCFPLYYYDEARQDDLLTAPGAEHYIRRDAITDVALAAFRKAYSDNNINKDDLFYFVYGLLHSTEYKNRFGADLKKQLPRIPFARNFRAFSTAGRELAYWHLNYESVEPWPLQAIGELNLGDAALYRVQKMVWAKKRLDGKLVEDKTTLIYNNRITLGGVPPEALDYIVNGKAAIEWVIERYAVTTDKDSGITNDPNDWCADHDDPAYILNLVARLVRVSVETVRIVKALPSLDELK
jgi:predicted helicase